jgi:hypothetical protein
MFRKRLDTILFLEFTNKPWIPALTKESVEIYHNSLAIPRSLQHLMRALLLHPSVAVVIPPASK